MSQALEKPARHSLNKTVLNPYKRCWAFTFLGLNQSPNQKKSVKRFIKKLKHFAEETVTPSPLLSPTWQINAHYLSIKVQMKVEMRANFWREQLIGNVYEKRKIYYNVVSLFPHAISEKTRNTIKKDLPRTMILGTTVKQDNIELLLHQYATVMPCDSYIQGFAYLMHVLYHVYETNDKEHAMADTFWSFCTLVSIVRPAIPDHDPNDFQRYTKVWKKHYIKHIRLESFRTHTWLQPFYDILMPSLSVKWIMILFTQQFKIDDLLVVWDAIISCEPSKRTKLLGILAANITLQNKDNIEYWAENCPSEIGPRLMCATAKDGKVIVDQSRHVMLEYTI